MNGPRVAVEQRISRMRAMGVRGALSIEGATLRRLVKSTIAATLAFQAGVLIDSPRPVLASLGAILVVQVTVRATFARSVQLTIAVTLGLVGTLLMGHVFGLHWWSIAVVVLAGLTVGELLRLGPFSSQVAISAMLALSLGSAYGYQRTVDTALGAVIGVLVNALIAPPTYVQEASEALRRVGDDLGALLVDIGGGLAGRPDEAAIERWLSRAREIAGAVRSAEATVAQGEESLRFNHRARAELDTLERIGEARLALDHTATQTRGMVRSMIDLHESLGSPEVAPVASSVGDLLLAAGRQVAAFGRLQERPASAIDRGQAVAAHQAALAARDRVAQELRELAVDHDEIGRLLASILVDGERLLHEVDVDDGAHTAAVSTAQPTA